MQLSACHQSNYMKLLCSHLMVGFCVNVTGFLCFFITGYFKLKETEMWLIRIWWCILDAVLYVVARLYMHFVVSFHKEHWAFLGQCLLMNKLAVYQDMWHVWLSYHIFKVIKINHKRMWCKNLDWFNWLIGGVPVAECHKCDHETFGSMKGMELLY